MTLILGFTVRTINLNVMRDAGDVEMCSEGGVKDSP
jgi:hypothetical protein